MFQLRPIEDLLQSRKCLLTSHDVHSQGGRLLIGLKYSRERSSEIPRIMKAGHPGPLKDHKGRGHHQEPFTLQERILCFKLFDHVGLGRELGWYAKHNK
jgi:hypothetical protein